MGLFGRKVKNQTVEMTYDEFTQFIHSQDEDNALKLSAVYSAISIISNTMSKIPFSVINRFTKKEVDEPNLYNLLNFQPNDKMNVVDMHKMLWTRDLSQGEFFIYPQRGYRSLAVKELIPLDSVSVSKSDTGALLYTFTLNGKEKTVPFSEIIHIKEFTLDGITGISPLEYARQTISTGLNQEQYAKEFYENYGRPADYLKTVNNISDKKITINVKQSDGTTKAVEMSYKDYMRYEWEKTHSKGNRFRIAILDNGLDYGTVPQITPEQMQFVSAKTSNVEDIARIFDMAACSFKLGVGKQTYSNNEQGQICYVTDTIVPRLRKWETELTLKLLTKEQRDKGLVIKGNINAELRGDTKARAQWYSTMRSMGVYNPNEIRAFEDMPSMGELGDIYYAGPNFVPLERLAKGETAAEVTPNDLSEND